MTERKTRQSVGHALPRLNMAGGYLAIGESELQLEIFLAEVELHRLAFLAAFPNGLEPLVARAAVGGFVPDERHCFARLDAFPDIEEAVFFAVLRDEDLRDQFLRGVFDLEGIIITAARDGRNESSNQESAADEKQ